MYLVKRLVEAIKNKKVSNYVFKSELASQFIDSVHILIRSLVQGYIQEGKYHLNIAFGCTGGHHRSVAVAEAVAPKKVEEAPKAEPAVKAEKPAKKATEEKAKAAPKAEPAAKAEKLIAGGYGGTFFQGGVFRSGQRLISVHSAVNPSGMVLYQIAVVADLR